MALQLGFVSFVPNPYGSKNTITYAATTAIRPWLPPQVGAAMDRQEQFAMPGRREAWLTAAGSPRCTVNSSPGRSRSRTSRAHSVFIDLLADYRRPNGSYLLP